MLIMWVKAFHLIAIVCWFAVLFYLPRLFVYHAMTESEDVRKQLEIMERRLYNGIGIPSLIATVLLGGWLIGFRWDYLKGATWFWLKMVLVTLLIGYHHMCGMYIKKLAQGTTNKSHVYFRWFNEFPTIMLLVIVIMAVIKQPY